MFLEKYNVGNHVLILVTCIPEGRNDYWSRVYVVDPDNYSMHVMQAPAVCGHGAC